MTTSFIHRATNIFHLYCFFLTIISVIFSADSIADTITLQNNDKLTGDLVSMENDILTVSTEYADEINVKVKKISEINTENIMEVRTNDGEILIGRISTNEDGMIAVIPKKEKKPTHVYINEISAINLPNSKKPTFKGNVNVGASHQSGNTERLTIAIGSEIERRTEKNRTNLKFRYRYEEDNNELTERNIFGSGKFDYFLSDKFYSFLSGEFLSDEFKDINLRTVIGPGVGFQIWDYEKRSLSFETGLSYITEDHEVEEDEYWTIIRLATNIAIKLPASITFADSIVLYPDLEDSGEYQLRNEASFMSPIASGLSLRLTNIFDYDSDPSTDARENDMQWILGLQYDF